MHMGRCFLLMNKYFQGGRKQEEPDQPHNQAGKVSHSKKDLKTLQSQGQPGTEEQTGDNAEENSVENTARVQLFFVLQRDIAFCLL